MYPRHWLVAHYNSNPVLVGIQPLQMYKVFVSIEDGVAIPWHLDKARIHSPSKYYTQLK